MRKNLNQKEVEEISENIEKQFGFRINPKLKYFSKDEKEGEKIFIYSGGRIPSIPAEWVGLHLGTRTKEGVLHSLDGAWIMKSADRNVVEASRQDVEQLMRGDKIESKVKEEGYVIVKAGDLVCTGRASGSVIESLTPKSRVI